jgi:diguanylate cyclase (GGDEF)-like protein
MKGSASVRSAILSSTQVSWHPMTHHSAGLFEEGRLEVTLERAIARCLRHRGRLSLLLVDAWRGCARQRWNADARGRLLPRVVDAIRVSLRGSDILCPYGGGAFAVILPDTGAHEARLLGGSLCANVAAVVGDGGAQEEEVGSSVSVGLVALTPNATCTSVEELLAVAEQALHVARDVGLGCVVEGALPGALRVMAEEPAC